MKSLLKYKVNNLLEELQTDPVSGISISKHLDLQNKYGLNKVQFDKYSIFTIFLNQLNIFDYFFLF